MTTRKKNGIEAVFKDHLIDVPTFTPTVGRTFIELHPTIVIEQSRMIKNLFMK